MPRQIVAVCLLSVGLLALTACETGPTYSQSQISTIAANKGRVFFYCLSCGFITMGQGILVDNQPAGSIEKAVFFVDLPAGTHRISCKRCAAKGPDGTYYSGWDDLNIDLRPGEARYISFEPMSIGLRMVPVPNSQGSQEILNLPYVHS